jgi:hypothetical protein
MGDLVKPGVNFKIIIPGDTNNLGLGNQQEVNGKQAWYCSFGTSGLLYGSSGRAKSYTEATLVHEIVPQAKNYKDN